MRPSISHSLVSVAAALLLGSCSSDLRIVNAKFVDGTSVSEDQVPSSMPDEEVRSGIIINIILEADDLRRIIEEELYTVAEIGECSESDTSPFYLYFQGVLIDSLEANDLRNTESDFIVLNGFVGKDYWEGIENPCVRLEGRTYFGSAMRSNLVEITPPNE